MSNEELVQLIKQGINTKDNYSQLYINNKAYIYQIAKKYIGYADIEDLMQEAYFGLYEAVQRYDDSQGVLFMTYAGNWILQAIKRYIDNNGKSIRIPVHLQQRIYQYNKIRKAYESQLDRKPTDSELCRHLAIDSKALSKLKRAIYQFNKVDSLDRQVQSEDDSLLLGDGIADTVNIDDEVIDNIMQDKIKTELWKIVEANTNEIENKVINSRFKRSLSLVAIGEELGITREAVRQWESKGLRKLRRSKCTRELRDKLEVNFERAYRGSVNCFNYNWTSSTERVALRNIEIEKII